MKRRELSEFEKGEIRREQEMYAIKWKKAEEDMKKVTLVNCEKLAEELKKFSWGKNNDEKN